MVHQVSTTALDGPLASMGYMRVVISASPLSDPSPGGGKGGNGRGASRVFEVRKTISSSLGVPGDTITASWMI